MANLRSHLPPDLQGLVPTTITPLQEQIATTLIQAGLTPGCGQGPVIGANTAASVNCRICMDELEGELTLRHQFNHTADNNDGTAARPCDRTYHFSCVIEWAETNIQQRREVACPGDRQVWITRDISLQIFTQFQLGELINHDIRDINNVIPFWNNAIPGIATPPRCEFIIVTELLEATLRRAALGEDVGFVTSDVISDLPLSHEERANFLEYDNARVRLPGTDRHGGRRYQYTYDHYIYVQQSDELIDHEADTHSYSYMFIPVERQEFACFRRYLLGIMGEAMSVRYNGESIVASRVSLSDRAVVNLDAEIRVRALMLQDRARANIPDTETYFWPFENRAGGILMGLLIDEPEYPARNYSIDDLNLGQANSQRYARFVADNPNHPLIQHGDALVNDYVTANSGPAFPEHAGLEGYAVYYLALRDETGPVIHYVDLPEDWSPDVTPGGTPRRRDTPGNNPFAQPPLQFGSQGPNIPQPVTTWTAQPHAPHHGNTFGNGYMGYFANNSGNNPGNGLGGVFGNNFGNNAGDAFGNNVGNGFGNNPGNGFGNNQGSGFGGVFGNNLGNNPGNNQGNNQGNNFGNNLGNNTGYPFGNNPGNNFGNGFGNNFGAAIAENPAPNPFQAHHHHHPHHLHQQQQQQPQQQQQGPANPFGHPDNRNRSSSSSDHIT